MGAAHAGQPPISTVGQPGPTIVPVGPGMGPTQRACSVVSPTRAAGRSLIITVAEPLPMMPGPPGTQEGMLQGCVWSVTRAAGWPPMVTLVEPLMMGSGIGGCGAGVGVGAAGCIGAWQCGPSCSTLSVIRAAG